MFASPPRIKTRVILQQPVTAQDEENQGIEQQQQQQQEQDTGFYYRRLCDIKYDIHMHNEQISSKLARLPSLSASSATARFL